MGRSSFLLNDELTRYVRSHSEPPDEIARDLIAETAQLPQGNMQVAPEQGAFLKLLVQLTGARSVLEIGTFTGYSALSMARGLPDDGRLVALDVSDEWTGVARKYWERAGVAGRIDLRLGPALASLEAMDPSESFDLVFIDADKTGYPAYFAGVVDRVNPNGLILADNVLRHGEVVDGDSESVRAIREFNDLLSSDERVETVLLPVFDGLTFARKVPE